MTNLSPEKPKVFKEIARVLKPGGRLAVWNIVAEELPNFVRKSEYFYNTCVAGAISEAEYIGGAESGGHCKPAFPKNYIPGEEFLYMGKPHKLVFTEAMAAPLIFDGEYFLLNVHQRHVRVSGGDGGESDST